MDISGILNLEWDDWHLNQEDSICKIQSYYFGMNNNAIEEIGNYKIRKTQPLGQGACGAVYYGQSLEG